MDCDMTIKALDWDGNPDDVAQFCRAAKLAGQSDEGNAAWRQTANIRGGTDNLTPAFAKTCWDIAVEINLPTISRHLASLLRIDELLPPAEQLVIDGNRVSPGLAKYILRAVELDKLFSLNGLCVVEIGGGWGGLAAVIHTMFSPARYTIYDLPDVVEGQRRTLHRLGFSDIQFGTNWDEQRGDLLISDWAFSELTQDAQEQYGRQFCHFPSGAFMCQTFHYHKLATPSVMCASLERWSGRTVDWGPYCPHYIDIAFRHGDPRLPDVFIWRTP